jgi:hypothetical protein
MQDMHRTVMLEQPGAKQCPALTLKALLSIVHTWRHWKARKQHSLTDSKL